jgi:hypothetical protein
MSEHRSARPNNVSQSFRPDEAAVNSRSPGGSPTTRALARSATALCAVRLSRMRSPSLTVCSSTWALVRCVRLTAGRRETLVTGCHATTAIVRAVATTAEPRIGRRRAAAPALGWTSGCQSLAAVGLAPCELGERVHRGVAGKDCRNRARWLAIAPAWSALATSEDAKVSLRGYNGRIELLVGDERWVAETDGPGSVTGQPSSWAM